MDPIIVALNNMEDDPRMCYRIDGLLAHFVDGAFCLIDRNGHSRILTRELMKVTYYGRMARMVV